MTCRWVAVMAISVATIGARAADYYVDDAIGSDSWSGLCRTWDGKSCGPKKTIAAAMIAAQDGDAVIILPGEYRGNGNRDLDFGGKAITVQSIDPDDPDIVAKTVIDCQGTRDAPHRAFKFTRGEGSDSRLCGLTIQNGASPLIFLPDRAQLFAVGGGIACIESSPTLYNCVVQNCWANAGGAIWAQSPMGLTLIGCTLRRNKVCFGCIGSGPQFAPGAGAMRLGGGPLTMIDCAITDNVVYGHGGGGAGLSISSLYPMSMDAEIINSTFVNNHVLYDGRSGNSYSQGGAIALIAPGSVASDFARIAGCRFENNSAQVPHSLSGGGAMYCGGENLQLVLEDSTFRFNGAPKAGAILAGCAGYQVRGCEFLANTAATDPAVQFSPPTMPSTWESCTIAGHVDADGASLNLGGSQHVTNCIFWNGTMREFATSNTPIVEYSNIKGGYAGTGNIDADPLFVDAANGDYHLAPGSPCINAGDPAASGAGLTDIDGQARIWGGRIDMGADEAGAFAFGDLNCDGTLNTFDINGFIQALSDPAQYAIDHPTCDVKLADANLDGSVNQFDIQAFISLLGG